MNAPVEQQLRQLPELDPPVDAWQRVRRVARRERWHARWRQFWPLVVAGGLTATAAVLVMAIVLVGAREPAVVAPSPEWIRVQAPAPELDRLQAQSRALETMLRGLPRRPELMRAENAAAITSLEDRIAELDWALSRSRARAGVADAEPAMWRERVGLMGQLVRARYTEAGVAAY
ncbi:MAG: hypothetical protein JSV45_14595 [Chromatiales bacterium]|nr:MAG: hypothetical protein JSV45_14595 [Chromatiales bacterium]